MSEERRASKIRAIRAMIGRGELASARREAVALLAHAKRDAEVHFCLGLIAHRAQHHRAAIHPPP